VPIFFRSGSSCIQRVLARGMFASGMRLSKLTKRLFLVGMVFCLVSQLLQFVRSWTSKLGRRTVLRLCISVTFGLHCFLSPTVPIHRCHYDVQFHHYSGNVRYILVHRNHDTIAIITSIVTLSTTSLLSLTSIVHVLAQTTSRSIRSVFGQMYEHTFYSTHAGISLTTSSWTGT